MAGEAGFLYEQTIYKVLKKYNLMPSGFVPAGAARNAPDSMFIHKNKHYKLELKLDLNADFGQGTLDYDMKADKWVLGGAKDAAADEMRHFLKSVGADKFANAQWGKYGAPLRFAIPIEKLKEVHVKHDYEHFKSAFIDIPMSAVENYYGTKETYYIQIGGGFGFYYLKEDKARLSVPRFNPSLQLRIRLKRGGSYPLHHYRFTTAILIKSKPTVSKYNLDKSPGFLI